NRTQWRNDVTTAEKGQETTMCQHRIFRFCGLAAAGLFALSNGATAQAEQKSAKDLIAGTAHCRSPTMSAAMATKCLVSVPLRKGTAKFGSDGSCWWPSGRWPCKRRILALTYWCGSTSTIVAPSSGRMYDFAFALLISSCFAQPGGSRGRQCDGERVPR